jgi:hypothetical protein
MTPGMTDEDLPGTLELDPGLLAAMPLDELGALAYALAVRYAWQLAALRELGARLAPRQAAVARWEHACLRAYDELAGTGKRDPAEVRAQAARFAAQRLGLGEDEAAELAGLEAWYVLARAWSVTLQGARDALAAGGLTFGGPAPLHDDSGHERAERRGAAGQPGPQPGGRDHDGEGGGAGPAAEPGRRKPAAGRAPGRRPAAGH